LLPLALRKRRPAKNLQLVLLEWLSELHIYAVTKMHFHHATEVP
jgi:hypothetical protein